MAALFKGCQFILSIISILGFCENVNYSFTVIGLLVMLFVAPIFVYQAKLSCPGGFCPNT